MISNAGAIHVQLMHYCTLVQQYSDNLSTVILVSLSIISKSRAKKTLNFASKCSKNSYNIVYYIRPFFANKRKRKSTILWFKLDLWKADLFHINIPDILFVYSWWRHCGAIVYSLYDDCTLKYLRVPIGTATNINCFSLLYLMACAQQ